jgi:hypothetical protein
MSFSVMIILSALLAVLKIVDYIKRKHTVDTSMNKHIGAEEGLLAETERVAVKRIVALQVEKSMNEQHSLYRYRPFFRVGCGMTDFSCDI